MIYSNPVIKIHNGTAKLSEDIYLYKKNRNVTIRFKIDGCDWRFMNYDSYGQLIESQPTNFTFRLMKDNEIRLTLNGLEFRDGTANLVIGENMTDENPELGDYDFQLTFYDETQDPTSILSIPPVYGQFHIRKHIFEDVDELSSLIGYATIDEGVIGVDKGLVIADDIGTYAESDGELTQWSTGDIITASRMNAIHKNVFDLWYSYNNMNAQTITYNKNGCTSVQDALDKLMYVPLSINTLTCNTSLNVELGSSIVGITFSWSYNKDITRQTFDGVTLSNDARNYTSRATLSNNKTFTLVGSDGQTNVSKSLTLTFTNGVYWGAQFEMNDYNSDFIRGLNKALSDTRARTINVDAGVDKYIYYAYPTRLGKANFNVGGFDGGFKLIATIPFTNIKGYVENYYIYRSDNHSLGATAVRIS